MYVYVCMYVYLIFLYIDLCVCECVYKWIRATICLPCHHLQLDRLIRKELIGKLYAFHLAPTIHIMKINSLRSV